jgi:hypothetical protein
MEARMSDHKHSGFEVLKYGHPCPICAAKEIIELRSELTRLKAELAEARRVISLEREARTSEAQHIVRAIDSAMSKEGK